MRGFYIGRFQPYHEGHQSVIERIASDIDELVLGIGSADQSHTTRNPFTAGERVMMITKSVAAFDLITYAIPIEDFHRNSVWVSHVQSMSPRFDVAYSNNPHVMRLFEEAGIEVRSTPMIQREEFEGYKIRDRMHQNKDWKSHVPDPAVDIIEKIDGVNRLQHVNDSDASGEYTID